MNRLELQKEIERLQREVDKQYEDETDKILIQQDAKKRISLFPKILNVLSVDVEEIYNTLRNTIINNLKNNLRMDEGLLGVEWDFFWDRRRPINEEEKIRIRFLNGEVPEDFYDHLNNPKYRTIINQIKHGKIDNMELILDLYYNEEEPMEYNDAKLLSKLYQGFLDGYDPNPDENVITELMEYEFDLKNYYSMFNRKYNILKRRGDDKNLGDLDVILGKLSLTMKEIERKLFHEREKNRLKTLRAKEKKKNPKREIQKPNEYDDAAELNILFKTKGVNLRDLYSMFYDRYKFLMTLKNKESAIRLKEVLDKVEEFINNEKSESMDLSEKRVCGSL